MKGVVKLNNKPLPWGIFDVFIVLIMIFLVTNLISWLIGNFINTLVPVQKFFISTLIQTGSILLSIIYFLIFKSVSLGNLGFKKGKSIFKVGILGGLFLFILVVVIGVIIELLIPMNPNLQPFAQIVLEAKNTKEFLVLLIIGTILAPLGEEIYFRGLVYPAFKKKWGIKKGMLLTGAFFALLHFDLIRFVPLAVGGAGLAYLYEKTGSIITPMVAHGTWNGIMMILLFTADFTT
jgi:hypothetical protein